jgi:hypothetical protein
MTGYLAEVFAWDKWATVLPDNVYQLLTGKASANAAA